VNNVIVPRPPSTSATEIVTIRDHFAAHALSGLIAADTDSTVHSKDPNVNGHAHLAKTCYRLADAMLAARKAVL
jgi:hypothetical protein